jgi:hypothetical protein
MKTEWSEQRTEASTEELMFTYIELLGTILMGKITGTPFWETALKNKERCNLLYRRKGFFEAHAIPISVFKTQFRFVFTQ